jgi:hypothetical protein
LPRGPCGGASVEDIVDPRVNAGGAKVTGEPDACFGKQGAPALGPCPGRLAGGQRRSGQPGETHLWMDLDHTDSCCLGPPFNL